MFRSNPSRAALWICAVLLLAGLAVNPRWKRERMLKHDVLEYYAYLPATFVHGDLSFRFAEGNQYYGQKMWGRPLPQGGFLQKYTCGLSLLMAPFFLVSHAAAHLLDYPADGYSKPYHFGIALSAAFYTLLGLVFLRRLLLRHFTERVIAFTLITVLMGTNLLYFTSYDGGMPHASLFFLVTLFAWLVQRFHETAGLRHAIALSLVGGLATLVRPTHALLWLLPLCYGITSIGTLQEKWHFIRQAGWRMLVLPLGTVLFVVLQMGYWHEVTGNWVVWSYGDEHFFWDQPMLAQLLVGFRKGWLIYTPVMAIALMGIIWLGKYAKAWALPVVVVMAVALYVLSCWWCWWYGGCFGMRPMIDFYGLLAIPLAAAFTWMAARKLRLYAMAALTALLVLANLAMTVQYLRGIIHHDSMTAKAWVTIWLPGDTDVYKASLSPPDVEGAKRGERNFW